MRMAKKHDKKKTAASIEEQYGELFQYQSALFQAPLNDESSLEQPSPLRVVPSLTTYNGAYEEPILGA
jgi:hypothetical protein